jgi:outer membrane lipoprotein SlyB
MLEVKQMFQGGSLWAGVLSGGMSQVQDTQNLAKGQIDRKQYAVNTTGNVTGAVGIMAGVEYGAVLGSSLMPGIGTAVGAVVGGLLGDRVGRAVGAQAGNLLFNNNLVKRVVQPVTGLVKQAAQPVMQTGAEENR